MDYRVKFTETGIKEYYVTAENEKDAFKKAKKGYRDGVYVLDYENVQNVKIEILK